MNSIILGYAKFLGGQLDFSAEGIQTEFAFSDNYLWHEEPNSRLAEFQFKYYIVYIQFTFKNYETTKLIHTLLAVAGIITYEITAQVDFVCVIYCATATLLHIHALESCCNHAEVKHEIIIIAIAAIPAAAAAAAAVAATTTTTTTTTSTLIVKNIALRNTLWRLPTTIHCGTLH
uniref:Uncharacterized protein n=1 Tax=Glossina pallidipes TaxID=7398 RepID=A0A1A9ZWK2_GLOPL